MRVLTILLVLLALALAGCGGDDGEAEPSEEAAATAPVDTSENEGEPEAVPTTGGEGADALIVVDEPKDGDTVSTPVRIRGHASVFEATLAIRIRDAEGDEVGTATITSTAGAPERGTFDGEVPYEIDDAQEGTIEVFSPSAEDGSDQHKVTIRVTLEP